MLGLAVVTPLSDGGMLIIRLNSSCPSTMLSGIICTVTLVNVVLLGNVTFNGVAL